MAVFSNYFTESYYDNGPSVLEDIDAQSLLEDTSVLPCHEDNFVVAAMRICTENVANADAIYKACAINEFCVFESTGQEMIYEGEGFSGWIEKIKQWFLKLWEKIKSIFKKAIMMFNTKAKNDKDFYNKYKKEINDASNKSFDDKEVSMYKYVFYDTDPAGVMEQVFTNKTFTNTNTFDAAKTEVCKASGVKADEWKDQIKKLSGRDASGDYSTARVWTADQGADQSKKKDMYISRNNGEYTTATNSREVGLEDEVVKEARKKLDEYVKKLNESDWKTDYYDALRASLVKGITNGNESSIDSKSFINDIKEACQKDSSKEDVPLGEAVRMASSFLQNSDKITKALDKSLKDWKKEIDDSIKSLNRIGKDMAKDRSKEVSVTNTAKSYDHTMVSTCVAIMQEAKNIGVKFHGVVMSCIKACSGQSKAICVQAVHYKKPKNESFIFDDGSSISESGLSSIMNNIHLV